MLRPWKRNREAKTKPGSKYAVGGHIQGPRHDDDSIPAILGLGVHWIPPENPPATYQRAFFESAFPAALHPNECVFDYRDNCVREDHNHGDEH